MRNVNRGRARKELLRVREQERQVKRDSMDVRERLHLLLARQPDPSTAQRERKRYVSKMVDFLKEKLNVNA